MSNFTVVPIYRGYNTKYSAPSFQVDANSPNDAKSMAIRNSALGRFPEWDFHVIKTENIKVTLGVRTKKPTRNPKSKSQLGKIKTGHDNSRPVRRGLRRLSIAKGSNSVGSKVAGAIKMW